MASEGDRPAWWAANERDRAVLDLPTYEPPRFDDGGYVHEVVADLEGTLDCEIRLLGRNVTWGDAWEVRIDGTCAFTVERTRDDAGNTHYQPTADEFGRRVTAAARKRGADPDCR